MRIFAATKHTIMAGIYIHIPFCKSRCTYCGFFSTTSLAMREAYTNAICKELHMRRDYLNGQPIETIYLGGGTPSILKLEATEKILSTIYNIYNVRAKEITMECNPDDLIRPDGIKTGTLLPRLRPIGVNRLSIGVQTFNDTLLRTLNRRHTAIQAQQAVHAAHEVGFDNVSIDLMFGLPGQMLEDFKNDVSEALSLDIQHLSVYSLSYEEGTPLHRKLLKGLVQEADEELSRNMYEHVIDATTEKGLKHYEISNFAVPGKESIHNSNYWRGIPYIGVGAGAHSFDTQSRQFNIESLPDYIKEITDGTLPMCKEILTTADKYNEYVFTALRTRNGLNIQQLHKIFGPELHAYFLRMAKKHIDNGFLYNESDQIRLTRKALFISNDIMSDLMFVAD